MPTKPDLEGASIVVIGNFNPAIFHPMWFKVNELLADAEAESAGIDVVSSEITSFTTQWCRVQVLTERFSVETTDPARIPELVDLVLGVFSQLEHCPIRAFGLNRHTHFKMASESEWHAIGHLLAPKEIWEPVVSNPGTRTVSIWSDVTAKDECRSRLQVRFEPSGKVRPGVFFELNRHYDIVPEVDETFDTSDEATRELPFLTDGTRILQTILAEAWQEFESESDRIVQHVLTTAKSAISTQESS